ncbi:MAG TPA: UbiA-like polyprenyltransferase [Thermodesulfovibrionales bacterium]|nr:UbiA-like polyprenyltransferase [Thermodesulfovibrionales bacterium]
MEKMPGRITLYLRMIKFSHSVFALPFAFTGALFAASGVPPLPKVFWIIIAMVGARSGAMGLNRIIDSRIDKENPRTRGREIPSGKISIRDAAFFTAISLVILEIAAYNLNALCLKLSPLALSLLILYSYSKRFTWMSHFLLGIAISLAPLGAWIAVRGTIDMAIFPLTVTVVFWLAGFDVLYALQDTEFDRSKGLYSIPQRFGLKKALFLSRSFHGMAMSFLIYSGLIFGRGVFYWIGIVVVAGLFIYEHSLVKSDDLSKLDVAFFTMNGYISVAVFLATLADYLIPLT